jgi:phosphatidylinositol-3-phosphatase
MIALSTPSFDAAWGRGSAADYLNRTLKPAGAFLARYESLSSAELPDYLALISGEAPNGDTENECATYSEFPPGRSPAASGQVPGPGSIYPNTITTVADQVTASGQVWKGYIAGLASATCVHPNSGAADDTQLPGAGPQYATVHNPFIFFHSLLDLGGCASDDVSLSQLPHDLRSLQSTPRYSFIAPGACDDGSAQSCPDGQPAGVAGEDAFLREWVPKIERSAAYKDDGLIVIVFAPSGGGAGGGPAPTGALVLSPLAARDKRISAVFSPYSILRSTEDLLGYQPLAHAKNANSFVALALPSA